MDTLLNYSTPAFQFANGVEMQKYSNQGNVFYVRPSSGSDGNDGRSPQTAFATLATALGACTANQNDIVYLMAESNTASATTDYQSVALDWNKDGVHLIGVNNGVMIGQRSRISNLSTATAIVDGLFIVSADNCLIANIEVYQGQGGTNPTGASIAVSVTGQRNRFVNCQFSGIGHSELDDATSRSLKLSGSENIFQHCYIGLDTIIRATATNEVEIAAAAARNIFEDCVVNSYTSLSTFKAVTATTLERFVIFKNCIFSAIQNITSAVAPTGAISNVTPNGNMIMLGGCVAGYANVCTSDDTKLFVSAPAGGLVDMGLATGVDIA
jgi:hypothetical protein